MKLLFVKHALKWPRASGHDVHGYNMMRSLCHAGHAVSLATVIPTAPQAIEGIAVASLHELRSIEHSGEPRPAMPPLQERFRNYYGVESSDIDAVRVLTKRLRPDAVIAVGLEVLPYLTGVSGARRVWYAADEWLWHHLSQMKLRDPRSWHHVPNGIIKGLYERAYHRVVDVTWVVSDADRRAMRLIAGMSDVAVIPNGVDTEFYQPQHATEIRNSAAFWGRLDFGPNVDALTWFCREIWPEVRRCEPDGRFTIIGYEPSETIRQLAGHDGVELKSNVEDLPSEACRHGVAILPFISGGGIKNKLLEAAALGRAIVCSPVAARGLQHGPRSPFVIARSRAEWVETLRGLWADDRLRRELGISAREWVTAYHNWPAAAEKAVASLTSRGRGPRAAASV
jgi:glycosyltransferase involved in cell wall biosynthesis